MHDLIHCRSVPVPTRLPRWFFTHQASLLQSKNSRNRWAAAQVVVERSWRSSISVGFVTWSERSQPLRRWDSSIGSTIKTCIAILAGEHHRVTAVAERDTGQSLSVSFWSSSMSTKRLTQSSSKRAGTLPSFLQPRALVRS
jgi:hypothetical protein